jgi:mono/diheme cytochrome c family protein
MQNVSSRGGRGTAAALVLALLAAGNSALSAAVKPHVNADSQLAAGRHIVLTAGCNHCHTQGWQATDGAIPQSAWLKGGIAPPNVPTPSLRVIVHALPQSAFVALFRTKQPPSAMPWVDVRNLGDTDLDAVYAFIHALK